MTPSGPPQPAAREQAVAALAGLLPPWGEGPWSMSFKPRMAEDFATDLLANLDANPAAKALLLGWLLPENTVALSLEDYEALKATPDTAPVVTEDETDAKDRARAAEFAWELAAGSPSMQDDARRMLDVEPPIVGSDMGTERDWKHPDNCETWLPPDHVVGVQGCAAQDNRELEPMSSETALREARKAMEDRYHDLLWCNKDDDCHTKAEGARLAIEDFEDALELEPLEHPRPGRVHKQDASSRYRQALVHAEAAE